jgi:hypothetical protein
MTDDTSYEAVVSRTDTSKKWPDDSDIDVRVSVESRPSRLGAERSIFQAFVVDHEREVVLYESRRAREYESNPSPAAISNEARGYARGYMAGAEGKE